MCVCVCVCSNKHKIKFIMTISNLHLKPEFTSIFRTKLLPSVGIELTTMTITGLMFIQLYQ